ncbi:MAG: hypothetical protein DMG07_21080 [Acidobacteria bacterium]|nr:MAG: hypothetical protein DMG07_21080 [Acidobacteriota bacterium]
MPMTSKQKLGIALVLLAVAEVVLFTRSFGMFFCGDSLYYLSRRLTSARDLIQVLTHVDYLEEYRPLPFMLFSFVYFPLLQLDPFGYHFIPLLFHLANTLLVFRLARTLLDGNRGAFIAALFFGIHWGNFFITYDITMMTEFTSVFFFLVASILFLGYLETGKGRTLTGCLAAFVLSLLAKEAAITFVATSVLTAVVTRGKKDGRGSLLRDASSALRKTLPIVAVAAVYLVALLALKDWNLFPLRTGHPHHAVFTLATLLGKGRYLQWAFGIPDALILKREALGRLATAAALAPFVVLFALGSLAGIVTRSRIILCGLIWSIATLSPVLFLPNLTMVHYLYLPIVGIAFVYGAVAERLAALSILQGRRQWIGVSLAAFFTAANVAATWSNSSRALADSWLSNGSRVAESSLRDLKSARPELAGGTTLYFLKSTEKDLSFTATRRSAHSSPIVAQSSLQAISTMTVC